MFTKLQKYGFLFSELVKRDFKKKYKRTVLGMLWSLIGPLLQLLVMSLIFTRFFGRSMAHYTIYLFAGNLVFSYFKESTNTGMCSLVDNAGIITKINVPKYLFLLSKNVSALINFLLTLCVFFLFCAMEHITFSWRFIALVYPVGCLLFFNIGVGMTLSALFIMFRDIQYLYDIFTMLLMYLSVIFYTLDSYSERTRYLFYLNPVYVYIRYFRIIVLENRLPAPSFHALAAFYAVTAVGMGAFMYVRYNYKFLYYV
ncbi:MAG: ABC transporter permease [Clostridiales bacterium]|jgi:ABC-2 type transport system permease protein|nr:ABC transporter permease [Clostridiales bacterium]